MNCRIRKFSIIDKVVLAFKPLPQVIIPYLRDKITSACNVMTFSIVLSKDEVGATNEVILGKLPELPDESFGPIKWGE